MGESDRDNGMQQDSHELHYHFSKLYLEAARAAVNVKLLPITDAKFGLNDPNTISNMQFPWQVASIIFSYMAVEAFYNYQLRAIWDGTSGKQARARLVAELGAECTWKTIREHNLVRKLPKRIKLILKVLGFQSVYETNKLLWDDFLSLVKDSRDFFIHPDPDPAKVQEVLSPVMSKTRSGKYSEIASGIIKHMYCQSKAQIPTWLEANQVFGAIHIEYLGP